MSATALLIRGEHPEIKRVLELLLEDWVVVTTPDSEGVEALEAHRGRVVQLIISLAPQTATTILEAVDAEWEPAADQFVLFAPTPGDTVEAVSLQRYSVQLAALEQVMTSICREVNWIALLQALRSAAEADAPRPAWAMARLERTISGRRLHGAVEHFSHGRMRDLANRFLAPARLLQLAGDTGIKDEWKGLWAQFVEEVLPAALERCGVLGLEFSSARAAVQGWLDGATLSSSEVVPQLDRIMRLMTEARLAAGERSASETAGASEALPAAGGRPAGEGESSTDVALSEAIEGPSGEAPQPTDYLVLVVDDHAAAWRPVFARLCDDLWSSRGRRIRIEFSPDGANTKRAAGAIAIPWGDYDLVILDVFLGSGRDGRKILNRVRKSFAHLPILLWTTSRDEELTAHASRANGILLKKAISWRELIEAVDTWLPEGRAKRLSLPSAFFNHTLRNEDHRRLVWDCTDWCLKQLDSFHALDGSYFRYFTDHGGRHIIKLLELLAQALRPFLEDPEETVLPSGGDEREFELLSLYLAVVFHELGMFPMRLGPKVERFEELTSDYLDDVRSLHSVRGMALLCDGEFRFWSDEEGKSLGRRMGVAPGSGAQPSADGGASLAPWAHPGNPSSTLRDSVAALVGYHARFFESMSRDEFLTWGTPKRMNRLRSPVASLSRADGEFRSALAHLQGCFPVDKPARERLRRQCALFRFVDALDIAGTRNPAEFLILNRARSAENNREYLKRQICREVSIRAGGVDVKTCAPPPQLMTVELIVNVVSAFQLVPSGERARAEESWRTVGEDLKTESVRSPWRVLGPPPGLEGKVSRGNWPRRPVAVLQRQLDAFLTATWRVVQSGDSSGSFAQELKSEKWRVLDPEGLRPRLTLEGKKLLASISALSVAGEVIAEYQAVEEADLERRIRLGRFGWAEKEDLETWKSQPPTVLTTLSEGLEHYLR
jgi:CheY-like chemotaxis protein